MITAERMMQLIRSNETWDMPMRKAIDLDRSQISAISGVEDDWFVIEGPEWFVREGSVASFDTPSIEWWRGSEGSIRAEVAVAGTTMIFVADPHGRPVMRISDSGIDLRTISEVEDLKDRWMILRDCDPAEEIGFAAHRDELADFRDRQIEAERVAEEERLSERAEELGCPGATALVSLVEDLERRLKRLEPDA